jgi:hypothetical protein
MAITLAYSTTDADVDATSGWADFTSAHGWAFPATSGVHVIVLSIAELRDANGKFPRRLKLLLSGTTSKVLSVRSLFLKGLRIPQEKDL